jgi:hypothetical protein
VADRDQRRAIIDADPGNPLQCQHAAAGAPPIDPRHAKIRVAGEILGELRGGGGLKTQVHFELNDLGQHLDHLDRLQPSQQWLQVLAQAGQPREEVEVTRKCLDDSRPQDLDRDVMPLLRPGEMNLGNRRCRDCGLVERLKQRFERTAELDFDQRTCLASRKRRQTVLQARQIESDLLAEEIGSGR